MAALILIGMGIVALPVIVVIYIGHKHARRMDGKD